MKEKVTFKSFFSTIWRGIVQVFQWILNALGLKDESKYALFLKRIIGTALAIWAVVMTLALFYAAFEDRVEIFWARNFEKDRYVDITYLSPSIAHQEYWRDPDGRIYNYCTGKVVLKEVDWVMPSSDNDSLAVYARNGKRGYLNRFTGKVVAPEQYDKAWVFSEGLAAVVKDSKLFFIDHKGECVLDGSWAMEADRDYLFKDGYCVVTGFETGKNGLIDRNGDWVIQPEYNHIINRKGYWQCLGNETDRLLDVNFQPAIEGEFRSISFYNDCILAQPVSGPQRAYDFDANLLNDQVIDSISELWYIDGKEIKEEDDDDGMTCTYSVDITKKANCKRYCVYYDDFECRYGLMDQNGNKVTEPLYSTIQAIGPDRYLCGSQGVVIDSKGRITE